MNLSHCFWFLSLEDLFKVLPHHQTLTRPLQSFLYFFKVIQKLTCWCDLDCCSAAEPKWNSTSGHALMAEPCVSAFSCKEQDSWFRQSQQVIHALKEESSQQVTSWMSCRYVLGLIFIGWPILGTFNTVPRFSHLWIMTLTLVHGSLKALAGLEDQQASEWLLWG